MKKTSTPIETNRFKSNFTILHKLPPGFEIHTPCPVWNNWSIEWKKLISKVTIVSFWCLYTPERNSNRSRPNGSTSMWKIRVDNKKLKLPQKEKLQDLIRSIWAHLLNLSLAVRWTCKDPWLLPLKTWSRRSSKLWSTPSHIKEWKDQAPWEQLSTNTSPRP